MKAGGKSDTSKAVKIIDGVWWVGVNDRVNRLFEGMWGPARGHEL